METSSPPLTPIRDYVSPIETSPTNSYHEQLRRRTSSFSSNHSRSPVARKHRFSNASSYSNDISTPGAEEDHGVGMGNMGGGNLADELDQLDDEEFAEGDTTLDESKHDEGGEQKDGAGASTKEPRDSGIDVTYRSRTNSPQVRNFSKPFALSQKPPNEQDEDREEEQEDKLSPELEDAMNDIARMTSYASSSEDPLIPRTIALLQDLANQAQLETGAQRLTTSTNSMTTHLTAQIKALQQLSTSLLSPFLVFSSGIDPELVEETAPLIEALLKELPVPDTTALQGMQKLDRETANVIHTLSQLTDTIQMGKQITNSASRHLRTTQTMVTELRREQERAELARHELSKDDMTERLSQRRCASECKDVMSGFEEVCNSLRSSLEQDQEGVGGDVRRNGGSDEVVGKAVTTAAAA
ncbi:hypothetical protein KC356_g3158 [Hortaea werneckii]|nr:hypothetical protein KC356_g3158 [Hortaea werneckii]